MSRTSVLAVLARASWDDRYVAELTDDFPFAVRDYDLTVEERGALSSGDIGALARLAGPIPAGLDRWPLLRLEQDSGAAESFDDRLDRVLISAGPDRGNLIPLLQKVQEEFGYLPERAMMRAAAWAGVPESRVYAVGTFYAQFRFAPLGRKHVVVCRGTGCHVRGSPGLLDLLTRTLGIKEGETSPDREWSLETVACIGACGLSPCLTINKRVFARMTPDKVRALLASET